MSALAVALGLAAGAACAQSTKTVINAVTNTNYPPFKFRNPITHKIVGFDIDLLEAIAAKIGAKVNWSEASFSQLLSSILTKRADVIVDVADTPERRESVNFVDYLNEYSVFVTVRDNAARSPNPDVLCGTRVAASRATAWPGLVVKWSDEHCTRAGKPAVMVVEVTLSSDMPLALNQGRVDAFVTGAGTVAYQNEQENKRYVTVARLNQGDLQGFGFSKDNPELGQALKKGLAAVMADGTYKNLMHKWMLAEDSALERPMINGEPENP
ncbi:MULTISPECIES: ABC transporter substrate-binding protein [unclassified Bradyrhizobium]